MNYQELLKKYKLLLAENRKLNHENTNLKQRLGIVEANIIKDTINELNNKSDSENKIKLFMSLFKSRDDVYAIRWENKEKETSGYSPVCLNLWKPGLCLKPKETCSGCSHKLYAVLDDKVIDNHLRGNITAGVYPMFPDETCAFLTIDFDDKNDEGNWQRDISVFRIVCLEFDIPIAIERSRSGKGGHVWFFFKDNIPAVLARRIGNALLTYAMSKRHEIAFKSYDRIFPNQNTMPKGGLGNLIALPLQKAAREADNSEFVDENYESYNDQWAFLSSIKKISLNDIEALLLKISSGDELGVLKNDEEDTQKPWEKKNNRIKLLKKDFVQHIDIVKANMLFIPKAGISERALNCLKRLASFKTPNSIKLRLCVCRLMVSP